MLGTGGAKPGHRGGAFGNTERAARLERATRRKRGERRHCPRNRLELMAHELRRCAEQAGGVRMARAFEHFSRRAFLHNSSRIRDGNAIRNLRDDS